MSIVSAHLPGIELAPSVWTDRDQLHFGFSRSSGPGGQNVNKVNTKTELRVHLDALHGLSDRARVRLRNSLGHRLTNENEIVITADNQRTQEANRRACMGKLRDLIEAAQHEPKIRKKTKPGKGAKLRRLDGKKKQSEKKKSRGEKFE